MQFVSGEGLLHACISSKYILVHIWNTYGNYIWASSNIPQCNEVFELHEVSPSQIDGLIYKLSTSKASGRDNIPVRLLKLINFTTVVSLLTLLI